MSYEDRKAGQQGASDKAGDSTAGRSVSPGKRPLSMGLQSRSASPVASGQASSVQRKANPAAVVQQKEQAALNEQWMDVAIRPDLHDPPVQRKQATTGRTVQRKGAGAAPSDPAQVTEIAETGIGGGGGALPHRAQIEAGFGVDLSDVRAHTGADAAQASRAIGAEAYTVGSSVAFASPSPSPDLVAHEVAHVIQQQSGAGPSSGVGEAGDSFEREADQAAATVAGGGTSDLASRYTPATGAGAIQRQVVQRYESAEHAMIGDGMQYPFGISPMELPNHAFATRGELVAFGDFYESYDALAQAPREETEALVGIIRWEAIWTLAGRQKHNAPIGGSATTDPTGTDSEHPLDTAAEPDDTGWHGGHAAAHGTGDLVTWDDDDVWNTQIGGMTLRAKAQEIHAQFSPTWQFFGMSVPLTTFSHGALTVLHMKATLGRRRFRNVNNTLGSPATADLAATDNPATADPAGLGGDYFDLASNNLSHFAITNWATWEHYHQQVCELVSNNPDDPQAASRAVIEDAWGCHYLTDMYAAGHLVDKQELMTSATSMMVDMSQQNGLSEAGDNRHEVLEDMLRESLQIAIRDESVYGAWRLGCRNAFDQGLIRYDEMELMLTIPRGSDWSHGKTVVGNLVATIMGMPWRNLQSNNTPGGGSAESFGPTPQANGAGDYHLGVGNLAALTAHNALNAIGIQATNDAGDTWRMQGDGHLRAGTQAVAQKAVDESTAQARAGNFNPQEVKKFTPRRATIDPQWVTDYYAGRTDFQYDQALMDDLMAKVQAAASTPFELFDEENATVSTMMRDICHAIMKVEFTARPGEHATLVEEARNNGDDVATMSNTGINISFLREFLRANLPRMVPVAYASASPGDLPSATLEVYQPRDPATGAILPTAANDFQWSGSTVNFRLNVSGCTPGSQIRIGLWVRDQDSGIDYLPSGQLEDAPAGRDTDSSHGQFVQAITVPANATPDGNGRTYVDTSFTLSGDSDHGEHYLMVYADPSYRMVIGRSSPRDSGETSNASPLNENPRATGPDAFQPRDFNAAGVDGNAFAWDGNTVRFRLTDSAPPTAPAGATIRAWVKQFNRDSGYDYDTAGREIPTEFFEPRDDDDLVGGPTMVSGTRVLLGDRTVSEQVLFNAVNNDGDTYIIVYADAGCSRPLARSHVQGTNRGSVRNATPVQAATGASSFSWSGNRLSFAVTPPNTPRVWVKLFDKDSGFDYDTGGRLMSGSRDEDEQYGGIRIVNVADGGRATIEATGDANHEDTYAIVYADAGCTVPLARSGVKG